METKTTFVMGDKEEKILKILISVGYPRCKAKLIIYLLEFKRGFSSHIEHVMDMRQPEVSLASKQLEEEFIIKYISHPPKTKGRPKKELELIISPDALLKKIEKQVKDKLGKEKEQLKKLKKLIDDRI